MENEYIYAQLDKSGFCTGISVLSGEVVSDDLIRLESCDTLFLSRKYDLENKAWTDEYLKAYEPESEPTNSEIFEKLEKQEKASLDREEILLEQQLLLLSIDLNTSL